MDLIEYINKFTELDTLIRAVYGSTERGSRAFEWGDLTWCNIPADIPNWNTRGYLDTGGLYIRNALENSEWSVPVVVEKPKGIGGKDLYFGFWLNNDDKKYHVHGFERR